MTDKELLEAFRSEIRRLRDTNHSEYNYQNAEGYIWALNDMADFLNGVERKLKNFNDLYDGISSSEWFKRCYAEKPLGDFIEMYGDSDFLPKNDMPPSELCDRINPKAVGWPEEEKEA
jgi:hypothetical protein